MAFNFQGASSLREEGTEGEITILSGCILPLNLFIYDGEFLKSCCSAGRHSLGENTEYIIEAYM